MSEPMVTLPLSEYQAMKDKCDKLESVLRNTHKQDRYMIESKDITTQNILLTRERYNELLQIEGDWSRHNKGVTVGELMEKLPYGHYTTFREGKWHTGNHSAEKLIDVLIACVLGDEVGTE